MLRSLNMGTATRRPSRSLIMTRRQRYSARAWSAVTERERSYRFRKGSNGTAGETWTSASSRSGGKAVEGYPSPRR